MNLQRYFDAKDKAIVDASRLAREIVRHTSKAVLFSLRGEFSDSEKEISKADKKFSKFSSLSQSPFNVEGEIAEAKIVLNVLKHGKLPSFNSLNVSPEAYVYGCLDAVGEIKRAFLIALKSGDVKRAKRLLKIATEIYDRMFVLSISRAALPDFKRKLDVSRIQVEQMDNILASSCPGSSAGRARAW